MSLSEDSDMRFKSNGSAFNLFPDYIDRDEQESILEYCNNMTDEEVCKMKGWETNLPGAMERDDKEKFVQYMAHPSSKKHSREGILLTLTLRRAVNCAKAVLEGETYVVPRDINAPMPEYYYLTPLHAAALLGYHEFVTLFLQYGASPNIRFSSSDRYSNMLPVDVALHKIATDFYVRGWTVKMSVFNLIIRLFLDTRGRLQCVKLLTSVTKDIDDEILLYALKGRVIEVAALMLADHEKVLPVLQMNCCPDLGFERTLRRVITGETSVLMKIAMEMKHHDMYDLHQGCKESILVQMRILQFFEVFRSAGDQLAAYLRSKESQGSPHQVVEEVARILKKAGFALKDEDSDLSNYMEKGDLYDFNQNYMYAQPYEQWRFGSHRFLRKDFDGLPGLDNTLMNCHDSDLIFQIKEAIEKFCNEYLKDWNCKMPNFELLYILFLPELENELNDIRHACDSITTEKIALLGCYFVKEGKLAQFAALLRAGHKKLISQTGSGSVGETMKIHNFILSEIQTTIDEEISSMRNSSLCISLKDKRVVLSCASHLLDVFESAGEQLEAYLTEQEHLTNIQIVKDVAYVLCRSGFVLSDEDVCVQHLKCFSSKLPQEKLESLKSSIPKEIGSSVRPLNSLPSKEIGVPRSSPHAYIPVHSFHTFRISKGSSNVVLPSPLAVRANRIRIKSHLPSPNCSLGGKWASLAFAVIRGLKQV